MTERAYKIHPVLKTIAQRCVERADACALKGKKRDDMALDFFIGAVHGLRISGDEKAIRAADVVESVIVLILRVRGYAEVQSMAAD